LIDMMQRQVEQMVRLIDDLLDVARISRGRIELRTARTELAAVIRNAVEVAQPLCDSMNHRFEVAVAPEPIFLEADAARLAQVIGNLLNNACKFTPRGGQVRLEAGTEGGRAVVRVRDNGVGIPADQLPRIFATFSQLDSSLDRSQGGWGSGSRWPAA
jgi:signal transduction histidine kinase